MADLLILEMDRSLGAQMVRELTQAGHACRLSHTVSQAQAYLREPGKFTVLMNTRFPWAASYAFLKSCAIKNLPIIFLTEDDGNQAHLEALYPGLCRVLVRPFGWDALVNELEEVTQAAGTQLSCGSLQINLTDKQVILEGQPLSLTAQEFALLEALMQNPETTVSREELLRTAWGYQCIGETRTVDVHIQRLRKKLGVERIETVYKLGYKLRMA